MRDGFLYYFLISVGRRLPMLIFATGAIVFALIRRKRSPRASLMTAIAFVIYLLDFVIFTAFLYWFPELTDSWRLSITARQWVDGIIFFLEDFVTVVIIVLLTAAAFTGRNKSSTAETT
jgi:amino acid permease